MHSCYVISYALMLRVIYAVDDIRSHLDVGILFRMVASSEHIKCKLHTYISIFVKAIFIDYEYMRLCRSQR